MFYCGDPFPQPAQLSAGYCPARSPAAGRTGRKARAIELRGESFKAVAFFNPKRGKTSETLQRWHGLCGGFKRKLGSQALRMANCRVCNLLLANGQVRFEITPSKPQSCCELPEGCPKGANRILGMPCSQVGGNSPNLSLTKTSGWETFALSGFLHTHESDSERGQAWLFRITRSYECNSVN